MRRFLYKIRNRINTISEKFSGWRMKKYHSGGEQYVDEKEGFIDIEQDSAPLRASIVSRRKMNSGDGIAGVRGRKYAVRNKKRFMIAIPTVAAFVLVPVIAVAANGGMQKAAPQTNAIVSAATESAEPATEEQSTTDSPVATVLPLVENDAAGDGMVSEGTLTENTEMGAVGDISSSTTSTDISVDTDTPADQQQTATNPQQMEADPQDAAPKNDYKELVPDTNHSDVIDLQTRLMELHYMENDEATDFYGPATKQAVGYFQRKHGLAVDGAAGVETQKMLFSEDAKEYSVTTGADGPDVEGIQQRLADLGYSVSATAYFGTETEDAVKYFQRMNGLTEDGSVGFNTKELLYSDSAEPAEEYVAPEEPADNSSEDSGQSDESSGETSEDTSDEDSSGDEDTSGSDGEQSSDPEPEPEPEPEPAPAADPGNVEAFVNAALAQKGKSYVLGGKGPDTFDCSGLVYYALNASGNSVGYMTSGGWRGAGFTTIGSIGELQRGDVICMSGHVGIYLGGGMMVDASSSNGCVVEREVGSWAQRNFICGKRPLA